MLLWSFSFQCPQLENIHTHTHTPTHPEVQICTSFCLYNFRTMMSALYFPFQSNTTGFNLVFSLSLFVTPTSNSEKFCSYYLLCIYLISLLSVTNLMLLLLFPVPPAPHGCPLTSFGSSTPLRPPQIPSFSSTFLPTSPRVGAYFAWPQFLDFGLNCSGNEEKEKEEKKKEKERKEGWKK